MTAHELARLLLAMPDLEVVFDGVGKEIVIDGPNQIYVGDQAIGREFTDVVVVEFSVDEIVS